MKPSISLPLPWALTLLTLLLLGASPPAGEISPGLAPPLPLIMVPDAERTSFDPIGTLGLFEGAIYRKDGTINDWGQFAEWAHPHRIRNTPGYNCSGHVLAASRVLLDLSIPLDAARYDLHGDSGPGVARGQDWDFGWDIVMNLALLGGDVREMTYFDEAGEERPLAQALESSGGDTLRGFSVWNQAAWGEFIGEVREDKLYLASFSRVGYTSRGLRILHHHTVLILGEDDAVWAQGASPKNPIGPRVQSLNLSDPSELEALLQQFSRYKSEHVLITSVPLALNRLDLQP